jgi:4-amino-4-deoxy-L-arabinose transferase-like glycosyltransferase
LVIVVLVGAAVYLPRLGVGGLTSTEGHRAIPGWGMLESGDWLLPRMFGQVYLRKPPGMPWAIAASSRLFGETEFAARLPSAVAAIALAVATMVFARRWFGKGGAGLAAGLASLLTPWYWSSGRSAEIEAVNNLGAALGVMLVLELVVNRAKRSWWGSFLVVALLGGAVLIAALAKGPAAFAAIGSAAVVGMVMVGLGAGEPKPVARIRAGLWLMAGVVPAGIVIAALYALVMGAAANVQRETAQAPVTQEVTEFLWSWSGLSVARITRVLAMAPSALLAAAPGSLAMALVVKRPRIVTVESGTSERLAGAVVLTSLLSLLLLTVLGVGNPRYAMPSLSFVPVLAGYAWTRFEGTRWRGVAGAIVGAALLVGAVAWMGIIEPRERARSGRESGESLGAVLPDGAMIWADGVVEARPEVLWYAQRGAARGNRNVQMRWIPNLAPLLLIPRHGYLLLRTDSLGNEAGIYAKAGFMDRLHPVWDGGTHKYTYTLYRKD